MITLDLNNQIIKFSKLFNDDRERYSAAKLLWYNNSIAILYPFPVKATMVLQSILKENGPVIISAKTGWRIER